MGVEPPNVEPEQEAGSDGDRLTPERHERRVRRRAYEVWESEGRPDGRALDHWLRARWEVENAPDPEAEFERLEREFGPGPDKS